MTGKWPCRTGVALTGALALVALCGCITGTAVKEAAGERPSIEFRVLDATMPGPRLFWRERPQHAVNVVTLAPELPGCDRARFFVSAHAGFATELGDGPVKIIPGRVADATELARTWDRLPNDPCIVHVFAGAIGDAGERGVFVDTGAPDGDAVSSGLPEGKPPQPGIWFMVPFAPMYDAVFSVTLFPVFAAGGAYERSKGPYAEPVTVSFEFPDGRREEASLDYASADALLSPEIYDPIFPVRDYARWQLARFWIRAALMELALDHREVQIETERDGWRVELASVDGEAGRWLVDPRDAREVGPSLLQLMGYSRVLRLRLASPEPEGDINAVLSELIEQGDRPVLRRLAEDPEFADDLSDEDREMLERVLEQWGED